MNDIQLVLSIFLLFIAQCVALIALFQSLRSVKKRLDIEKIIVKSLAETLKEKSLDSSSISVKGGTLRFTFECPDNTDASALIEEIMKETVKKVSSNNTEVSRIIKNARDSHNEKYINALFSKSLDLLHKNA